MKKITKTNLQIILKNHNIWIENKECGVRANLSNADLCCADLYYANLEGANLRGANLEGANLRNADLCGANLSDANLEGANLRGANLRGANLEGANLCNADLCGANLSDADLVGADLRGANLRAADLEGSNLCNADLCGANLINSNFDKCESVRKGIVVSEIMIGYKKTLENKIIKLEIPEGAIVFSINNKKCRTNKAKVVKCEGVQHSQYDKTFEYIEGKEIIINDFNLMYNVECSNGIHFFRTKEEAENYKN